MSDLLSVLNDKQQEAVLATEGFVRVIAGAGSGKTKLLVSRYAYLVKEYGIDSANILCVTFTNKAAGEMKKRIRALIGPEYDTTLICTYHGFCNRLLRENPEKVFLSKEYQIIDSYQQKTILSDIYQKYELKLDYASFEATLKNLGMFKSNNPDYVDRMVNPDYCQILEEINSQDDMILEDFLQKQKATYSLDFHDLIAFAIYVLNTYSEIREKWQERLNYIMVDEFQDSSSVEMALIDILAAQYTNLMIVGDPDQNIYEWRGSDVELLVDFDKTHEPTNTIFLNQNYRSTPEILKCANTLIDKNELRLKKDLFTDNPHGADVVHYHSKNDFDEMDTVIKEIKKLRNQEGCSYSDFAIIYRSGFLSRIAEKKLAEKNIPYEIFGGVKFYQRMEILDIIAYLKLIAYDDDVSFRRIINTPRRKFGRSKMNALDELQTDKSLYETLKDNTLHPEIKKSNAEDFIKFIDDMRSNIHSMRIGEIVNMVTSDSGYEGYIRGLGDEERLKNLAEFKCIANEFEREFGEDITLTEFLQQIALQSGEDNEEERDAVKLMTIHASKGLEFPVVFILGFTEGIFPSAKTIEDRKQEGLEEERRLCYVAITRAQKHLYLMDSEGVSQQGIKKLCSRFLNEIGEQNYARIGKISDDLKFESKANIDRINRRNISDIASEKKKIGDAVNHPILGDGVIEGIDDKRGTYVIKFEKFTKTRNISSSFFNEEKTIVKDSSDNTNEPEPQPITEQTFEKESRNRPNKIDNSSTNLWLHDDVPHTGWKCVGVTDLGRPVGVCEMCGYQIIRYVHHMVHPDYPGELGCGCVCAGKMEGDIEKAKKRETDFKSKQKRLNTFKERKWRRSVNNNEYLKIDNHIVVIFNKYNHWKYTIDGTICLEKFHTREGAIVAAFEKLENIRSNN